MGTKLRKNFDFSFPLTNKVVRDLRIVTEHIGDLEISGTAYHYPNTSLADFMETGELKYDVDIDFIKWNGQDIKPVLELTSLIDDVHQAAVQHAAFLFTDQKYVA